MDYLLVAWCKTQYGKLCGRCACNDFVIAFGRFYKHLASHQERRILDLAPYVNGRPNQKETEVAGKISGAPPGLPDPAD